MGGTGNTGQAPEKQQGVQAGLAAGGDPALPQWGAGAAAPGDVAPQGGLPGLTEAPPSLRPYEETVGSTGAGAGPSTGLLAASSQGPMGFNHSPYPTAAAAVPTFGAEPAPVAAAAAAVEKAKLQKPYEPVFKDVPMRMAGYNDPEMNWQLVQNSQVRNPTDLIPEEGLGYLGQYQQRVRDYMAWQNQQAGK
jgi:hypothetical protein